MNDPSISRSAGPATGPSGATSIVPAIGDDEASPGASLAWHRRREALRDYFDRTAIKAWEQITSDAPVSMVRRKVREGRDTTRAQLLSWLPADMAGMRVLDAGCGTGALACECGARGAEVLGIDVSPGLIEIARERTPGALGERVRYAAGDMLSIEAAALAVGWPGDVRFDAIVAMDSLIHYEAGDMVDALATLARSLRDPDSTLLFTFAPSTPLLETVKAVGKLFPRKDRSPAIAPVGERRLHRRIAADARLDALGIGRTRRVKAPFYISQTLELASCAALGEAAA